MLRPLSYLLVTVFLMHQAFGLWINHARLAQINMSLGDDVELICTGSDMRWVSISMSAQANQLVFVEPPSESQQIAADELCPNIDARDNDTVDLMSNGVWISSWSAFYAVAFAVQEASLLTHKFLLSTPRGPPIDSL